MAFGTRQDADMAEEELADVTAESLSSFKGCGDKERFLMTWNHHPSDKKDPGNSGPVSPTLPLEILCSRSS